MAPNRKFDYFRFLIGSNLIINKIIIVATSREPTRPFEKIDLQGNSTFMPEFESISV